MYKEMNRVNFPKYSGIKVNMMPIVFGVHESIPSYLKQYSWIIDQCGFTKGDIVYLTVHESFVPKNNSQRRGGIHVEAPKLNSWGGGIWGGSSSDKGIYMASTDGACNVWNEMVEDRDEHGGCNANGTPHKMNPNTLYWMTDKTPHQALSNDHDSYRQFFRLVSNDISVWYSKHNTKNPTGVVADCEIVGVNKFKEDLCFD